MKKIIRRLKPKDFLGTLLGFSPRFRAKAQQRTFFNVAIQITGNYSPVTADIKLSFFSRVQRYKLPAN